MGICLRYPIVVLCHGYSAALDQQDWSVYRLKHFIDRINVGVVQLRSVDLSLNAS